MIRRREATAIALHCDACSRNVRVFELGTADFGFDFPEGWTSYPEPKHLIPGADPLAVLCPDHAHLTSTVRLMKTLTVRERDDQEDGMKTVKSWAP